MAWWNGPICCGAKTRTGAPCRRRLLLFWGRRPFTVTSSDNSNWTAGSAQVEVGLLGLGVWRAVDAVAVLIDCMSSEHFGHSV
jgi:hypothetical protein